MVAAHDGRNELGLPWKCNGCIKCINTKSTEPHFSELFPSNDYPELLHEDVRRWIRQNRSPYYLLIIFGSVMAILWLITGIIGLISEYREVLLFNF